MSRLQEFLNRFQNQTNNNNRTRTRPSLDSVVTLSRANNRTAGRARYSNISGRDNSTQALERPTIAETVTTRPKGFAGLGSQDEWGRDTREEQVDLYTNDQGQYQDYFVTPDREPSLVSNYVDRVLNREIDYTQTRAWQRANQGYSTGTMFSSGVSRIGQLAGFFDSVISNPFAYRGWA